MKRFITLLTLLALMATTVIIFTACSSDDYDPANTNPESDVVLCDLEDCECPCYYDEECDCEEDSYIYVTDDGILIDADGNIITDEDGNVLGVDGNTIVNDDGTLITAEVNVRPPNATISLNPPAVVSRASTNPASQVATVSRAPVVSTAPTSRAPTPAPASRAPTPPPQSAAPAPTSVAPPVSRAPAPVSQAPQGSAMSADDMRHIANNYAATLGMGINTNLRPDPRIASWPVATTTQGQTRAQVEERVRATVRGAYHILTVDNGMCFDTLGIRGGPMFRLYLVSLGNGHYRIYGLVG